MSYDNPPPPPPPPPGGSPYGAPPPAASSGTGTAALVCGIIGLFVCGPILGIIAVVLGRRAQAGGQRGGTARAGEILGYIDIALWVLVIVIVASTR
jgi:hypothetical protein